MVTSGILKHKVNIMSKLSISTGIKYIREDGGIITIVNYNPSHKPYTYQDNCGDWYTVKGISEHGYGQANIDKEYVEQTLLEQVIHELNILDDEDYLSDLLAELRIKNL